MGLNCSVSSKEKGNRNTPDYIRGQGERILKSKLTTRQPMLRPWPITATTTEMWALPWPAGPFLTSGMVVAPCTIKTLSGIANSYTDNLLVEGRGRDPKREEKTGSRGQGNPLFIKGISG